jgi:hypothetical protein
MARYKDCDKCYHRHACAGDTDKWNYYGECPHYINTADVAPKSEVAREIFAEIEKECVVKWGNSLIFNQDNFYELKKKYDVPDTNVGDKYFTAEQVRAMSREEVRKNYSAIMESMKKWGEQI